jgi:hypothetical protein
MIGNGIRHTTVSVGTGPITLAGVAGHPGYQHVFGATGGRMVAYCIAADEGGQPGAFIESGVGDFDPATLVLTRFPRATWDGTSYSADLPTPVDLAVGTKHVLCAPTAELNAPPGVGSLGDNIGMGADNSVLEGATVNLVNGRRTFAHIVLRHPRAIGSLALRLGGTYTGGSFAIAWALYELNQLARPYRRITPLLSRATFFAGTISESFAPRAYCPPGDYALGYVADFSGGTGTPSIAVANSTSRSSPFGTQLAQTLRTVSVMSGGTGALPADASGLTFATTTERVPALVLA